MITDQRQSQSNSLRTITAVLAAIIFCAAPLAAQTGPPAAPLPAQLATAKTAFLANGGAIPESPDFALSVYNNTYQDLVQAKLFRLTSTPAEADLVLEVSYFTFFEGGTYAPQFVQLVIRDAKTQSLLWTLSEAVPYALTEKTYEKNIPKTVTKLVADLSQLINGDTVSPNSAAPTKTRLSNEGSK